MDSQWWTWNGCIDICGSDDYYNGTSNSCDTGKNAPSGSNIWEARFIFSGADTATEYTSSVDSEYKLIVGTYENVYNTSSILSNTKPIGVVRTDDSSLKTDDDGVIFDADTEMLNFPGDYSSFVFDTNYTILLWVRPNGIPNTTYVPIMEKLSKD